MQRNSHILIYAHSLHIHYNTTTTATKKLKFINKQNKALVYNIYIHICICLRSILLEILFLKKNFAMHTHTYIYADYESIQYVCKCICICTCGCMLN